MNTEPNFEARAAAVGIDRAGWELLEWQDNQRRAAVDAMIESSTPAS